MLGRRFPVAYITQHSAIGTPGGLRGAPAARARAAAHELFGLRVRFEGVELIWRATAEI